MINMAVISLKDIVKYFLKVVIVIFLIITMIKYLNKKQSNQESQIGFNGNAMLFCFDISLPELAVKNEPKVAKKQNVDFLQTAMGLELEVLSSISQENKGEVTNTVNSANNKETNENNTTQNNDSNTPVEQAQTGLPTQVQSSNVPNKYTTQYHGVKIKNETDYKLTTEILTPNITVNKKNIIIFHTHACESYTSSPKYTYKPTGNFRTTDKNYSVVRVGTELDRQLQSYGYNVIHNETLHDYPSYSGSYTNSLATVTKLLEENKNTDIVIDLHRDAIGDTSYAPTVKIGNEYAAQLMFVIGGNGSKIKHESWNQNLKFAVKIQEKANELYPRFI